MPMPILKVLLLMVFAFIYGCAVSETHRVQQAFDTYIQAIRDDKGVLAYSLVDQHTRLYWDELFDKILYAEKQDFIEFGLLDKMQVILARLNIPGPQLIEMNGQALFEYAVNQGWVGNDSMLPLGLGDIGVEGSVASGNAIVEKETSSSYRFHFYKETEAWKIDLTEMLRMTEAILIEYQEESGKNEEDFILAIVRMMTGKPVDLESIYAPPALASKHLVNLREKI